MPWSSEESLFSWDFLPSFSSACPNNSDNLQLNSRQLHIDWNQAVSEAYPISNTYSLRKYNQNADRGYPKAGATSWWTEASFPAWPSVPGLEPSPFLPSIIHGVPCLSLHPLLIADKIYNDISLSRRGSTFSGYKFFNPLIQHLPWPCMANGTQSHCHLVKNLKTIETLL